MLKQGGRIVPNQNQNYTNQRDRSKTSANGTFWMGILVLLILFTFSSVVLSIQLYTFATIDERVLSIKSNVDAQFDVFSLQYRNGSGEITVIGTDGEKIIAPGTNVDYSVRLRNADTVALDYEIIPKAHFASEYEIPVLVRVIGPDETYLVGDAKTWVPLEDLNNMHTASTLLKGESVEYVFQWKWLFDGNDDVYDTFLGDHGVEEKISVTVAFDVFAEANTSVEDNGGWFGNVYGPTAFLLVFVIILLIGIVLLLIYKWMRRRADKKAEEASGADDI